MEAPGNSLELTEKYKHGILSYFWVFYLREDVPATSKQKGLQNNLIQNAIVLRIEKKQG